MKLKRFFMATLLAGALLSCGDGGSSSSQNMKDVITKSEIKVEDGIMNAEVLYSFGRIGSVALSPDQSQMVYQVSYVSIDENRLNPELFIMDVDGENKKRLTYTNASEGSPQWIEDGKRIAYLSNESGSSQIWTMMPDGSGMRQVSDIEGGINGFVYSPDGTKVLFIKKVKWQDSAADLYPDLPEASGLIRDDLMYKHWDHWVTEIPHVFVADLQDNKLSNVVDLLEGEPYEAPMLPFGGVEQVAWSPDSKTIAYTSRKKEGREYTVSTNSNIYFYDIASGETRLMTEGMMGYDMNPQFSPDGTKMAWQSQERDGYEADQVRLFVMDLASGEKSYITHEFDYNVDAFEWAPDNETIYLVSCVEAKTQLFSVNINDRDVKAITEGKHDYASVAYAGDKLIAKRRSMSYPDEIFSVDIATGEATELSFENKHILDQITMGETEERWITTTDGKQMLTWVVYPPNFDPNKKYPALLYCQGGPQSTVSQFWSYRWNPQMMAANDYIIVMPNRRGVPGFGQKWNEQISGDYGGQNMKDYLAAIDAVSKEPFIDTDRLGCTGASYGGFSTLWLAGNHDKRFKAFFAHAGIFNLEAQYLETEESWFANWDMGGAYWDKSNAVAQRTYATSPHKFVDRWDTPIMVSHGEFDYRIVATQSMMAFNAAQMQGIPSRMLIYPDENHWITKPQNGILFQREFFRWFDQWLKD